MISTSQVVFKYTKLNSFSTKSEGEKWHTNTSALLPSNNIGVTRALFETEVFRLYLYIAYNISYINCSINVISGLVC